MSIFRFRLSPGSILIETELCLKLLSENIVINVCNTAYSLLTLNHATCDVYSPKAVGTLIHGYRLSLRVFKRCFLFALSLQLWSSLTLQLSLSLCDK